MDLFALARARLARCMPAAVGAVLLFSPGRTAAWSTVQIRSVNARVEVELTGRARVAMVLAVEVHGGWLSALDIDGLDPELELDPTQPGWVITSDEAQVIYAPKVTTHGSQGIRIAFDRQGAPRAGRYLIGVRYLTDLAHRATTVLESGMVRVRWSLPGFENGLDGVTIELVTPPGAVVAEDAPENREQQEVLRREERGHTILTWRRPHLGRTLAWSIAADIPSVEMAGSLARPAASPPHSGTDARPAERRESPHWKQAHGPTALLAAALALLAILKILALRGFCRQLRFSPRPIVPLGAGWRVFGVLSATLGAVITGPESATSALACLLAVVLLALERSPVASAPPTPGRWRPASPDEIRRAQRWRWWSPLGLTDVLDATSLPGVLTATALLGFAGLLVSTSPQGTAPSLAVCGLLFAPLLLTGTRGQLPHPPLGRLARLLRWARRTRTTETPFALGPTIFTDVHGRPQDARLRIFVAREPAGLARFDVALADAPDLGGIASYPVLVAVAARNSPAERAIGRAFGPESVAHVGPAGRHIGRVLFGPASWPAAIDAIVRELAGAADHELRPQCKAFPGRSRGRTQPTGSLPTQALQPPLSSLAQRRRG